MCKDIKDFDRNNIHLFLSPLYIGLKDNINKIQFIVSSIGNKESFSINRVTNTLYIVIMNINITM